MDEFKNIIGEFKLSPEEIEAIRKPDYSFEYNETSIRIDAGKPRLEDRLGDGSRDEPTHPWEVIQIVEGDLTKLFVRSGRVIVDGDPVVTFEAPVFPGSSFALINPNTVIYLKFTRADGTGELLTVTVDSAAAIPVDTSTEEHWTLAEVTVEANSRGDVFVAELIQRLFEDVRLEAANADNGPNHPWKVTQGTVTVTPGVDPAPATTEYSWEVVGGEIYGQTYMGTPITVADTTIVSGPDEDEGFIVLKTTRDSGTRELTDASGDTEILFYSVGAGVPSNDYTNQYRPLAKVVSGSPPLQLQFEEIRIWEDLILSNGEYLLHVYDNHNRLPYYPP